MRIPSLTKLLMPFCVIAQFLLPNSQNLQNLSILDLSRSFGLRQLPLAIGDLVVLKTLNLGGCWQLATLPPYIGQLAQLEVLLLNGCSSLKMIPDSITCLRNLTELDLQQCSILTSLPHGISEGCTNLCILWLQQNFTLAFPEFVCGMNGLQILGLSMKKCVQFGEQQVASEGVENDHNLPEGWYFPDVILQQTHLEQEETRESVSNGVQVNEIWAKLNVKQCRLLDWNIDALCVRICFLSLLNSIAGTLVHGRFSMTASYLIPSPRPWNRNM